jgi:CubicO group peptidase (beta-lactamase class C family)
MPGSERWGLGVRVITGEDYGPLPVGAFGWSGAYGTHFWVDPTNEICAVYLKNSVWDGGSGAITARHFEEDVFSALI